MARLILRGLIAALGLWVAGWLLPHFHIGVSIEGWKTYLVAGLLLGVVNAIVRPVVTLLTLPITIVTLGLFLFIVNGLMVLFVSWILKHFPGFHFHVGGIVNAIMVTIVIWLVSLVANLVIGGDEAARRR
jgi:putative membrane protein